MRARPEIVDRRVDVLIVGGGMVGASLALALATVNDDPPSVLVVEARAAPTSERAGQVGFDARSTALSLSSYNFYNRIGLWSGLAERAQAIRSIHVSDRGRFGSTVLECTNETPAALGFVVENPWLGRALHAAIDSNPAIDWQAPATVREYAMHHGHCIVERKDKPTQYRVSADLVVVADGSASSACQALGVEIHTEESGHCALVANVVHRRDHAGRAYERFTEYGPMALLPLVPDQPGQFRSALIWVNKNTGTEALMAISKADFLRRLQRAFGYRAGRFEFVGTRQQYPLRMSRAGEQVRAALVVLGNAAHTLHPVAGQGFNLALRDVSALAERLGVAHASRRRLGDPRLLQTYLEQQRSDQQLTTAFSDLLPGLFASGNLPLVLARSAGLIGLDLLPGARSQLVRFATGYSAIASGIAG